MTRPVLAIDTATASALVALGGDDGSLRAAARWPAGFRHGEELLARLDALLAAEGTALRDLAGIAVGTGPGAFTGLRVGIATAKGLAHGLRIPLVGVRSGDALLAAARLAGFEAPAILLPAGPSDRVLVAVEATTLLPAGTEPELTRGATLVALDLEGRAHADALARGELVGARFAEALVAIGAARLAEGTDELASLVPDYVTLPRGVQEIAGEVAWSHDRR